MSPLCAYVTILKKVQEQTTKRFYQAKRFMVCGGGKFL